MGRKEITTKEDLMKVIELFENTGITSVSYTHLDVYKRQRLDCVFPFFAFLLHLISHKLLHALAFCLCVIKKQ